VPVGEPLLVEAELAAGGPADDEGLARAHDGAPAGLFAGLHHEHRDHGGLPRLALR